MTKTLVRDETFNMTRNTERARMFFEDRLSFMMTAPTLYERMRNDNFFLWDVRTPEEFNRGHIPNSKNMPMEKFETEMRNFSRDRINVLYTNNNWCHRAYRMAKMLSENNYPVMVLEGGFESWEEFGFNTQR